MNGETINGEELTIKRYHTSEQATIKEIETSVSTTKPLDYQDLVCPIQLLKVHLVNCVKFVSNIRKSKIDIPCHHKLCNECYLTDSYSKRMSRSFMKNDQFIVSTDTVNHSIA